MVGVIFAGDDTAAPALISGETSAAGLPLKVDPPAATTKADGDASGLPVGAVAGIAIAVGLVSAGGGFAIRRQA